jgi:putative ABC transport system permease protein
MTTLLQDLRYGWRLLARSPGFAALAVLALALGTGANTAIFSVVNGVLLRPLSFPQADRLAVVWERNTIRDRKTNVVSPGNFLHWRDLNQSFQELSAVGLTFRMTLTGTGEPEELPMQLVNASLFPLVGVRPAMGRTFTPAEDRPDADVVVLSDQLWRRRFGADPSIVGRTIRLDGVAHTVVGVMPRDFYVLDRTVEFWRPIGFSAEARTPRGRWLYVIGRLKPQVTMAQAQVDMERVAQEMTRRFPAFNTGWSVNVVPLKEQMTGAIRPMLLVLLGAVGFVLLIACANVANLLLARATVRTRELALRAALGANRGRLIRQLLAESLVLALISGAAGTLLAWWVLRALRAYASTQTPIPRLEGVSLDVATLGFALMASFVTGIVFGIVPALTAARADVNESLKEGGRTGTGARGGRARAAFVVAEVALALVLLVGAGLLVRSFIRLLNVDPGFQSSGVITMKLSLPELGYPDDARRVSFFRELFGRIERVPGVRAAGGITWLPLTGLAAATSFEIVGQPKPPAGQEPVCEVRVITNDYFKAMGIPLLRGRTFTERETPATSHVVVINENLAKRYWPSDDPIGKRISVSWTNNEPDEVIGVVGDVHHAALDVDPRPMIYWPHVRSAYPWMLIAVRTAGAPTGVVPAITAQVRSMDANLPVADVRTMEDIVSDSVAEQRLTMTLLGVFAALALVLSAIGIYGVIGYMVVQRTQEIGIRMALGAARSELLRLVIGQAMRMALAGVALGVVGAFALMRVMQGLLFGVQPSDPLTFVAVSVTVALVALGASGIPALRATRVNPVVALRTE